jgi:hypothetical protein
MIADFFAKAGLTYGQQMLAAILLTCAAVIISFAMVVGLGIGIKNLVMWTLKGDQDDE